MRLVNRPRKSETPLMNDSFAKPNGPHAQSAANDLRAAADGNSPRPTPPDQEQAQALKESAALKAARLRDYAGEKAQDLKAAAGDRFDSMKDGAEETALQLKGAASEQWQDTRLKARELHASVEDYVRTNPTKAVLTAAGVGLIVGLLSRR